MLKGYQPDLKAILANWNLKPIQGEKIKDVFKIVTAQGVKNLKVSPLKPKRLSFVHQAINHLISSGFTKMNPIILTGQGRTYVSDGYYAYTLFDWIEGRQCDFANQAELAEATRVLAEFHRHTFGFIPPAHSNPRKQLGKCLDHFQDRYHNLKQYRQLSLKMPHDDFAGLYLENYDHFIALAAQAINKLKESNYCRLAARAKIERPFCYGDPAARNFILTPEGRILMIDFDSCRLDLPIMDLVKFIRRVMKKYNWSYPVARLIMDSYQTVNPISKEELSVMKAAFYFPQKFWRISTRYFHQHNDYSPERLLRKLQKYLENRTAFRRFPYLFDTYQSEFGV
jgi:spore coat protein I